MHMYLLKIIKQFNIFCLRMKHCCTDRFSIPAWNNMTNNSGIGPTLTDPDKILQDVDQSQILRVKMLVPWAKWAQNGGEKSGSFCNGYNEFALLCNRTDQHEIRGKRQSLSCIEP